MASRADHSVFLNGRPARLGYLSQLRARPARPSRGRPLLDEGFAFCRALHEQGDAAALSDRHRRRQSRRAAAAVRAPVVRPLRVSFEPGLVTLAIPRARRRARIRAAPGIESAGIRRAPAGHRGVPRAQRRAAISSRRAGRPTICSPPGERPDSRLGDFLVAIAGGRVVGCAAIVGSARIQTGHRARLFAAAGTMAERGESGRALRRSARTAGSRTPARVRLPVPRCRRRRPADVTAALISEARRRLPAGVSLHGRRLSPKEARCCRAARAARHRRIAACCTLACWPDGQHVVDSIDARLPHPEVAIL